MKYSEWKDRTLCITCERREECFDMKTDCPVYKPMRRCKYDIEVTNIEMIDSHPSGLKGMIIYWQGNIGFGNYTVLKFKADEHWRGQSECMDKGEDKEFLELVLEKAAEYLLKNTVIVD